MHPLKGSPGHLASASAARRGSQRPQRSRTSRSPSEGQAQDRRIGRPALERNRVVADFAQRRRQPDLALRDPDSESILRTETIWASVMLPSSGPSVVAFTWQVS
jgi:hypothetical protein